VAKAAQAGRPMCRDKIISIDLYADSVQCANVSFFQRVPNLAKHLCQGCTQGGKREKPGTRRVMTDN
jgi:hypothetical protein